MNLTGFGNPSVPDCSTVEANPALNCFHLSSVEGEGPTAPPSDLVFDGGISGLPASLTGTLNPPDAIDLSAPAGQPVAAASVTARNFFAPDPTPTSIPPQRTTLNGAQLAAPDSHFAFFQRGDDFKAEGSVTNLTRVGYLTAVNTPPGGGTPVPGDTKVIHVGFGQPGQTIRAYADIDTAGSSSKSIVDQHITGDVTLTNFASAVAVCFRGTPKTPGTGDSGTYCDASPTAGGPASDQGAFQFVGTGSPAPGMGIHAFFRDEDESDQSVIAGATDITGIPPVVQGSFGGGQTKFAGYSGLDASGLGEGAQGIANITAEVADAELTNSGYPQGQEPFVRIPTTALPIPAPPPGGGQYAYVALSQLQQQSPTDFHASINVDSLQQVTIANTPCSVPQAEPAIGYKAPTDFPFLPTASDPAPNTDPQDTPPSYTCIRADFTNSNQSPLALSADITTPTNHISLTNGGLSYVPNFFQADLASVQATDADTSALRPACGAVGSGGSVSSNGGQSQPSDCVPPLLRVDTGYPSGTSAPVLYGVAELGAAGDLAKLDDTTPADANLVGTLGAVPTSATTWGLGPLDQLHNFTGSVPPGHGIRVEVGTGGTGGSAGSSDTAIHAALQVPIPSDLTVDQIGSWSCNGPGPTSTALAAGQTGCVATQNTETTDAASKYWGAQDVNLHYALRDAAGNLASPGTVTAMIVDLAGGGQTLVSGDTSTTRTSTRLTACLLQGSWGWASTSATSPAPGRTTPRSTATPPPRSMPRSSCPGRRMSPPRYGMSPPP